MASFLNGFDVALSGMRVLFLGAAAIIGVLCGLDWAARTRRISPFSATARWSRRLLAPFVKPVERSVLRAGGTPASAPWWTLIAVIISGIVVLSMLEMLRDQVAVMQHAFSAGPRGVIRVLILWTFRIFFVAIAVRVISSWFQFNSRHTLIRWSYALTEPILGPLRRMLPPLGNVDYSPIVAWLLVSWVIEPVVMSVL